MRLITSPQFLDYVMQTKLTVMKIYSVRNYFPVKSSARYIMKNFTLTSSARYVMKNFTLTSFAKYVKKIFTLTRYVRKNFTLTSSAGTSGKISPSGVPPGNFGTINEVCHEKFPTHNKFLFLARIPHHSLAMKVIRFFP